MTIVISLIFRFLNFPETIFLSQKLGELSLSKKSHGGRWQKTGTNRQTENSAFFDQKPDQKLTFSIIQYKIRDQPLIWGIIELSICSILEVSNVKIFRNSTRRHSIVNWSLFVSRFVTVRFYCIFWIHFRYIISSIYDVLNSFICYICYSNLLLICLQIKEG